MWAISFMRSMFCSSCSLSSHNSSESFVTSSGSSILIFYKGNSLFISGYVFLSGCDNATIQDLTSGDSLS